MLEMSCIRGNDKYLNNNLRGIEYYLFCQFSLTLFLLLNEMCSEAILKFSSSVKLFPTYLSHDLKCFHMH